MSMNSKTHVLFAIVVTTLAGCAGVPNLPMDESVRSATHNVRINPLVTMPSDLYFFGRAQGVAALAAGPLAGLMDDKLSAEPKRQLTQEIRDAHIDVPAMLAASFAMKATASAGLHVVAQGEPADAQVDLVVNRYGFSIAHPGTATLYPVYGVSAIMKNAKGQIIWQGSDFMSAHATGNDDGHTLDELEKHPEWVSQALSEGSDLVADMLVRNYKGEEKAQNVPGVQR